MTIVVIILIVIFIIWRDEKGCKPRIERPRAATYDSISKEPTAPIEQAVKPSAEDSEIYYRRRK
jgi:hypothetical protein